MKLRDYQLQAVEALWEELLVSPTALLVASPGLGKTEILQGLVIKALSVKPDFKACFIVNKIDLLRQTARRFTQNLPSKSVGIFRAMDWPSSQRSLTVATIQSIYKHAGMFHCLIIDECFSGDTEILTEKGFVRFDELGDEMVAQVKMGSFEVSFTKPIRKIIKKPSSPVMRLRSDRKINLVATARHEFPVLNFKNEWVKKKLVELNGNSFYKLMTAGYATGPDDALTPKEKLAICYQADGSEHYVSSSGCLTAAFAFSKQRKIDDFIELMIEGGFKWSEVKPDSRKHARVKEKRRFMVRLDFYVSKKISDSFEIKDLSLKKCRDILDYMVRWDGHKYGESGYYFSSTSKECADFYQSIACLAGYTSRQSIQVDNRKSSYRDVHRLFITIGNAQIGTQGFKKEVIDFKGDVYCVEVPHGNIIVRSNGRTIVAGNCHNLNEDSGQYRRMIDECMKINPKLKIVAVTATPYRYNGYIYGKDKLFKRVCFERDLKWAWANKYLVPVRLKHSPHQFDTSELQVRLGDYVQSQVEKLTLDESKMIAQIKDAMPQLEGRRSIVWACSSIQHAESVAHKLKIADRFPVSIVHSKREDRDTQLKLFTNGVSRHLVFVSIVSEGFDHSAIDAVVLMRPTRSPVLYVQTVGRGLRLHQSKSDCIVLDFGGVVENLGPLHAPYVRQAKSKKDHLIIKMKFCPACLEYIESHLKICPACNAKLTIDRADDKLKNLNERSYTGELPAHTYRVKSILVRMNHIAKSGRSCFVITYNIDATLPFRHDEYIVKDNGGSKRFWARLHSLGIKSLTSTLINVDAEITIQKDGKYYKTIGVRRAGN
jgi:superfamily II DNA or RNA helicase